jgi:tetratricopeptide (TPR) repeat protein
MKKDNILFAIIGLLAGLIIGFFATNQLNRSQINQAASSGLSSPPNSATSQGNPAAAVPAVSEAIEKADKNPDDFAAQMKAGEMFARIKNFDKAITYFEKADKLKPNDFQTLVIIGNTYYDLRRWVDAANYYEKALAIKSDDVAVRTDYGITFAERENPDYDRAIKEFEMSLKVDPLHEPTLFNLAVVYHKKGDEKNAQDTKNKLKYNADLVKKLDGLFAAK